MGGREPPASNACLTYGQRRPMLRCQGVTQAAVRGRALVSVEAHHCDLLDELEIELDREERSRAVDPTLTTKSPTGTSTDEAQTASNEL